MALAGAGRDGSAAWWQRAAQRILAETRRLIREHSRRWGEAALIFALRAGGLSTAADSIILLAQPDAAPRAEAAME